MKPLAAASWNTDFFAGMEYGIYSSWVELHNFDGNSDDFYELWTGETLPESGGDDGSGDDGGDIIDEIIDIIL